MFTDDLTAAMNRAVDDPPFDIDLDKVLAGERKARRRRAQVSATVATFVILAVVSVFVLHAGGISGRFGLSEDNSVKQHHIGAPQPVSAKAAVDAFAKWGPTRGSLARNSMFLAQVRQEWLHPTGPEFWRGDRETEGPIRVLFAGTTPEGVAAVVAQQAGDPKTGIYVGVMTTIPGSGLSLWGPNSNGEWGDSTVANVGRFDANQVSFTSGTGRHITVLPTDPSNQVAVSVSHQLSANGYAVRTWTPIPTTDGVATVSAPKAASSWDTLVRISHDGHLQDESRVWINAVRLPLPANEREWLPQNADVVGGSSGGFDEDLYTSWARRHGAPDEPYGDSGWDIGGILPDESPINVQQMWLYGDPAHTVVSHEVSNKWQVLYDEVSRPTAKPLLAVRLPTIGGWLIAAGPHATITGYRVPGATQWTVPQKATTGTVNGKPQFTRAAAFFKTLAPKLQIRLIVNGKRHVTQES